MRIAFQVVAKRVTNGLVEFEKEITVWVRGNISKRHLTFDMTNSPTNCPEEYEGVRVSRQNPPTVYDNSTPDEFLNQIAELAYKKMEENDIELN